MEASRHIDWDCTRSGTARRACTPTSSGPTEFRNERGRILDLAKTFDAIYRVAKAKGIEVEF